MRTKTILIAAAVALTAGVITTQAQVYSQNIVGYVNQTIAGGGALSLIENPILGTTNGAEQLLSLQGGETLYIWSGSGYYIYQYLQGGVSSDGTPTDWIDGGGAPIPGDVSFQGTAFAPAPQIAPGVGFFIQNPNTAETNTFVGSVVLNSTNTLAGGGALSLVGSVLPIGGNVETSTNINLPFQGGETLYVWDGTGYYIYQYLQGGVSSDGTPTDWIDGGGAPIPGDVSFQGTEFAPAPSIAVGQSFFYQNPNPSTNWIQNLSVQ